MPPNILVRMATSAAVHPGHHRGPRAREKAHGAQLSTKFHRPFDRTNSRGRHPPSGRDRAYPPPHLSRPPLQCYPHTTPAARRQKPPPTSYRQHHYPSATLHTQHPMRPSTPSPRGQSRPLPIDMRDTLHTNPRPSAPRPLPPRRASNPSNPYRTGKTSASSGATPATEQDAEMTRDETTALVAAGSSHASRIPALRKSVGKSYQPAGGVPLVGR